MGNKARREEKRALIPPYCELCGYDVFITRHRIKPGRSGGKYVAGNVIGLCPNCHVEAELGLTPKTVLFEVVRTRLKAARNGFISKRS